MRAMAGILDGSFGHQLGWALLHSVWEGALGAAIFGVIRFGMRRCSANARYVAGCLMLIVLIASPIATVLWTLSRTPAAGDDPAGRSPSGEMRPERSEAGIFSQASVPASTAVFRAAEAVEPMLPWVVQLWLGGVAILALRWYAGSRWLRRAGTSNATVVGLEWVTRLQELCDKFGLRRRVRLLKSALVEVPMVVGYLRPVILLPASALVGLAPRELEAILAHELAHVRRHDYLVNLFQNVVETLMFYHPAVWWVSRCIREEREHCCDDLVVSVCGDRLGYVRALVSLEEARGTPRLAFAATGGSLLCRVRRLLGRPGEVQPPSSAEFGGITLLAIGCVLIGLAAWLYNVPGTYQASALVKVNPTPFLGATQGRNAGYDPYQLQTECLVIASPAVLGRASLALKLKQASRSGSDPDALRFLRTHLALKPVSNAAVIEIQASDSEAARTAEIANAVATAYKSYRREQRRNSISAALDSLELRFAEQAKKIDEAAAKVDRLRLKLDVSDPAVSEDAQTMPFSAETLRHIEALRIESQTEYVKQRTLLTRLENLDPKDLPETIQAAGVADNQLAVNLEALAVVDQKLVSLRNEYGPQHTEILKAEAQDRDLRERITTRTTGILRGLRAKVESTCEGLVSLSNAVLQAQSAQVEKARHNQPYFEALRDLQERQRFESILQTKIALERTDLETPAESVEIIEDAFPPTSAALPNRRHVAALFGSGCLLVLVGCLLVRIGGPRDCLTRAA